MIKVNVEVLSGLHAGAEWSFSGGEITIGGNANCSVFLCDQGLPDFCLTLKLIGNRVLLKQVDEGKVLDQNADLRGKLGKWLYPEMSQRLKFDDVEIIIKIVDVSQLILTRFANSMRRKASGMADIVQEMGMRIVVAISLTLGVACTVVIMFLGTIGAELRAANKGPKVNYVPAADLAYPNNRTGPNRIIDSFQEDLFEFRDKESIQFTSYKVTEDSVDIAAEMSRAELVKFERLLKKLSLDYGQNVKIKANVALTLEQKIVDSLAIRSVSFGEQPVVTLSSGERLFIGSSYKNLEVKEVKLDGIVLAGSSVYRLPL